jgi:pimeloyl-ACP methyl ester carboxylesterase
MRVAARGHTFDVTVSGPAAASGVALLLHGFPQRGAMWDAVVPRLNAAGLRTVVPDQRGYSPGARPKQVPAYRVAELAADAVALLDALAIGDPVDLVGHDWGAVVGWHLAAHAADRVRTYTAVSVPHPAAFGWALATDADQRRRSAYMRFFRLRGVAETVLLAGGGRRLREIFDDSGLDPDGVDRYVAPLLEPGALTGALNWYRALRRGLPGVAPARVPTTYVWSDRDLAVGRTAAEACHRHVSGDYEFVELPGVSHWIPDQVPDRLADVVLTRISRGPAPNRR